MQTNAGIVLALTLKAVGICLETITVSANLAGKESTVIKVRDCKVLFNGENRDNLGPDGSYDCVVTKYSSRNYSFGLVIQIQNRKSTLPKVRLALSACKHWKC